MLQQLMQTYIVHACHCAPCIMCVFDTDLIFPQDPSKQSAVQPQKPLSKNVEKPAPASHAEVLQDPRAGSPSSRGAKRPHPPTPTTTPTKPLNPQRGSEKVESDKDEAEVPQVIRLDDMTKLQKEQVRRIVSPKKGSGNLEVPENIFEMWKDVGKGRDKLLRMWCKAGGVKAGMGPIGR